MNMNLFLLMRKCFSFQSVSAAAFFCLLHFLTACGTTGHSGSLTAGEPKNSKMGKGASPSTQSRQGQGASSGINQQTEKSPRNELHPAAKPAPKTEKKPEKDIKPLPLSDDISPM